MNGLLKIVVVGGASPGRHGRGILAAPAAGLSLVSEESYMNLTRRRDSVQHRIGLMARDLLGVAPLLLHVGGRADRTCFDSCR